MAEIIKANGEVIPTTPKNGKTFSLEEMQGIVGGYIEIVHLKDGYMVVNEEGLLMGLPINELAFLRSGRYIVGDVLVCSTDQIE